MDMPEYDPAHYNDILARSGIEWSTESMEGADASKLDGQTVMALLVASLRADRFCEGGRCSGSSSPAPSGGGS